MPLSFTSSADNLQAGALQGAEQMGVLLFRLLGILKNLTLGVRSGRTTEDDD
jgi:hypothetical protein